MNLWIRSQNKERLIKVSNVQYTYRKGDLYSDVRGKHYIGTYYDNLEILGEYTTKERALQILDEIQEAQLGNFHYRHPNNVKVSSKEDTIIYEMPKE